MSFLDKLGLTDKEEKPPAKTPTLGDFTKPSVQPTSWGTMPAPGMPLTPMAPTVIVDDEIYLKLKDRTDFDNTEIAGILKKYKEPLESLPMDPTMKFKTAIAMAKAQNGLTDEHILAAFGEIKQKLTDAVNVFVAKTESFTASEIIARHERIGSISEQIQKLQAELTETATALQEAQSKQEARQKQFETAVQRRTAEIENQQTQFTALLKG